MEELIGFIGVMGFQFIQVLFYIVVVLLIKHLIVSLFMRKPAK